MYLTTSCKLRLKAVLSPGNSYFHGQNGYKNVFKIQILRVTMSKYSWAVEISISRNPRNVVINVLIFNLIIGGGGRGYPYFRLSPKRGRWS